MAKTSGTMWVSVIQFRGLLAQDLKLHRRTLVECSQDQWDIYKLDPLYDCRVRSYPNLTVVSKVTPKLKTKNGGPVGPKRRASSTPEPILPPPNPRKKVYANAVEVHAESDEETEVEQMIVDVGPSVSRLRTGDRAKRFKEEIERNRKARREKFIRRTERLTRQEGNTNFRSVVDPAPHFQSIPPELAGKRKGVFFPSYMDAFLMTSYWLQSIHCLIHYGQVTMLAAQSSQRSLLVVAATTLTPNPSNADEPSLLHLQNVISKQDAWREKHKNNIEGSKS